jgi:hypothetical protein
MKKLIGITALCFLLPLGIRALETEGKIYNEVAGQSLNEGSRFNPGNIHNVGDFQYYLQGNLIFKNEFSMSTNGMINLEMDYYPSHYQLTSPVEPENPASTETQRIYVKEAYLDFITTLFTFRGGKQYVKWGSSTFFNPIDDIINLKRDPIHPYETEGNPFLYFTFPVKSYLTFELLGLIQTGDNTVRKELDEIPVLPKIAFSFNNFSIFGFGIFENGKKPVAGWNLDYAFPLGNGLNVTAYFSGTYRWESERERFDETGNPVALNENNYPALVAGFRAQWSFTRTQILDGINFCVEFYHNRENWSSGDFENYLDYLDSLKATPTNHLLAIFTYYQPYRNSRTYGYANLYFVNLFISDFTFGNDLVVNLEDESFLYMPTFSYAFNNSNSEVGLKGIFTFGNRNSEFGNAAADIQVIGYTKFYF